MTEFVANELDDNAGKMYRRVTVKLAASDDDERRQCAAFSLRPDSQQGASTPLCPRRIN